MPNRLAGETSPYLLQHANNPVDWYPWSDEALARAHTEDRPILLSIGYSACHWCHVMEHESFEDAETAQLMNDDFVSIKVDREERPDLDGIYMAAVQAMTGSGGWPMTVFLTPDGKPFFAGTYFPKEDRYGMPSFRRVLVSVAHAYKEKREEIEQQSGQLVDYLSDRNSMPAHPAALAAGTLDEAEKHLSADFEPRYGGMGNAPKFPQAMDWEFLLLRYWRNGDKKLLDMVEHTLRMMANGGIYDQLGGGFHRYSTDTQWLVPHFEKMLYDNALLARLYLHAYQITGDAFYRRIVEETLDYVAREMTSPEGGFYSTQDADSEGVEGKFYVWTPDEITSVLGSDDAPLFMAYYDVSERGNWEEHNILNVRRSAEDVANQFGVTTERLHEVLANARAKLYAAREERVHPGRDEKVLVSWNGLMTRAFAEAARVLGRDDYRTLAENNARFVLGQVHASGRLFRTYKDGRARLNAYLEDYSFYAAALLELYETTFSLRWYEDARALVELMLEDFSDPAGGFFDTAVGHEQLITRPKDLLESAIPSGNSVAVDVLLRLYRYTLEDRYYDAAQAALSAAGPLLDRYPRAMGHMLLALDSFLGPAKEIAILGDPAAADTKALLEAIFARYAPHDAVATAAPDDAAAVAAIPLLEDRPQQNGKPTVYVCENYACRMPVNDVAALKAELAG